MPRQLPLSLLLLRVSIFVVFLVWTLDKFFNPGHFGGILTAFYGYDQGGAFLAYVVGSLQMILNVAFVLGLFKTWTYGAVMVFHAGSTIMPFAYYLQPFDNLLFFTAWPMLAACIALFLLRDYDTMTLGRKSRREDREITR
jgi:uncharacterized membrane protein YphA (DoxX/SURF4 family)